MAVGDIEDAPREIPCQIIPTTQTVEHDCISSANSPLAMTCRRGA